MGPFRRKAAPGVSVPRVVPRSRVAPALALTAALALSFATSAAATTYNDSPTQAPPGYVAPRHDGLGVAPGQIRHVWVIMMENKSYDATFTGLNGNSYLWQTLPEQGALLTNYYGTGHSSEDNYLSLVSGQAPISDDQSDCPNYTMMSGSIDTTGSLATNPNFGQFASAAGPNAPIGDNGCVYPEASSNASQDNPSNTVETIFNQLDAAGKSWKVYAQDLYGDDNGDGAVTANGNNESVSHSAGTQYCGAPYSLPGPTPSSTQASPLTNYANPGSAVSNDQYVPKHNPAPWFESVLQSGECAHNVAPVLGANDQLASDLASARTTPNLSFIIPNNCSDAHDAVCAGNNLSGGFEAAPNNQIANPPINHTGGLYAGDLFLQKVVPEIESSPGFAQGGLIVVAFDEAFPPFTWQNSFVNSTLLPSTAFGSVTTDQAGETLYGRSVNWEPQGPNVPITYSSTGQVLTPGAGFGSSLDRPGTSTAVPGATVACSDGTTLANGWVTPPTDGCLTMGASNPPGVSGPLTGTFTAGSGLVTIPDTSKSNPISIKDEGRQITFTTDAGDATQEATDGGYFVGNVTNTYDPSASTSSSVSPDQFSFTLVKSDGQPVTDLPDGGSISFTLGAQSAATDPLYDAYDPTLGGGDTGAVLISPYIKPGTVSNNYYNHYSLLRTLEDLFQVDQTGDHSTAPAMTTRGGLDGMGHLGYAAQPGLAPFGRDVFTNAALDWSGDHRRSGSRSADVRVTVLAKACLVPDVRGYQLAEARAILRAARCGVGTVRGDRNGTIIGESLRAGTHARAGKAVLLTLAGK